MLLYTIRYCIITAYIFFYKILHPLKTFPFRLATAYCKALSTLSQKTATVAENGEKTATLSHFSATVWTGLNSAELRRV